MTKKRTILFLLFIVIVIMTAGGSLRSNDLNLNEINVGIYNEKLTEREKLFLSIGNDKSIVFKYKVKDKFNKIILWSEKYENGSLVLGDIGRTEALINDSGIVIITISDVPTDETDKSIANIFIGNELENSKVKFPYKIEESNLSDIMSTFSVNPLNDSSIKDDIILGGILYSKGDYISSLDEEVYKSNDVSLLKDYDASYIIRCKFVKE